MGVGGTTVAAGGSVVGGALIFAKIAAVMAGLAAAGLAVHDLFKGFLSLFIDFGEDAGTASLAVKGLWEAQEQEAKSTEKLTKAEEARQRILDARARFEDQEAKKADLERDLRGAQYDVRESRSIAGGETVSETDRARLTALEDVRAAENAILDDRKKQEDRIAYGHWESLNNRERVMKDLEAAQGRLLEAEKNRLKVIVDQKKQIGEQLKAEKEKLKVAEDATKSEKQRLLERYGRLNKLEKSRVDAIGLKQAQGGQLNKREIKVLEDAGLVGNIASDYYAAQGAVAGGSQTINNLGLMKQKEEEAAKIRAKKQDKEQELLRKKAEEDQAHAAVVSAAEQRQRIVNSRVAINANQLRVDPTEIAGYRSDQDQFVKELQKAATDARDASDNVTQRSIEVAQAMDHALGAMNDGLFELKRTIEKDRNLQKAYGKD